MPQRTLGEDCEAFIATLARMYAYEGKPKEVAVLARAKSKADVTARDNWDGGTDVYTVTLAIPTWLYGRLGDDRERMELELAQKAAPLLRLYERTWLNGFVISPEVEATEEWREKALDWVAGKGLTNQGRVRSDNIANRQFDGLLFRSQQEIFLYQALKDLGVSFAPLPVFLRGGKTYQRMEPDFVVIRAGMMMVVEVDGDTVHHESPAEAHVRTAMLAHEGVHIERVSASDCDSLEKARECSKRLLAALEKVRDAK